MGKIKKRSYAFLICFITGMLWGVIIGALSISILVSFRLDSFYEKIALLENTIEDKEEKLSKLEKSINKADIVLKDVVVLLEFPDFTQEQTNEIDNIQIEKAIKEKYRSSLGKEIKSLDAEILEQVIDKRILKLNNGEYQISVSKLMLTDILKLWVKVSLIEVES